MTADESEMRTLGDVVDVLDYRRLPVNSKERASRPGDVPYYGAVGRVGWIDEALFDEELVLLGEDGVQFFERDRPKAYLVSGPAWVNNHAHVLRVRAETDRRFLCHWLNYVDYRGSANGTTRLKLTQASMRRLPVWMPPLMDQRRIVAVLEDHLSRLDAADAYLDGVARRSDQFVQSRLREVLHGPGTWDGPFSDLCAPASPPPTIVPTGTHLLSGEWPVVDQGEGEVGGYTNEERAVYRGELPVLVFGDHTRRVKFVDRPFAVGAQGRKLLLPVTGVHPRFAFWSLKGVAVAARGYGRHYALLRTSRPRRAGADVQRQVVAAVNAAVDGQGVLHRVLAVTRQRSRALRSALLTAAFTGRLTGRSSDINVAEELAEAAS